MGVDLVLETSKTRKEEYSCTLCHLLAGFSRGSFRTALKLNLRAGSLWSNFV